MQIKKLKLTNFRNWENISFQLEQRVLIYGPNAFGKTNILESLYALATTRSFRGKDAEIIATKADFARIEGEIAKEDKIVTAEIVYQKQLDGAQKTFKINDKARGAIDFVGEFAAIVFSPEDLNLVAGPPEDKRRYMSFTIGQRDREYLFSLLNYKKVLRQRNELLKKADLGIIKDEIDIWDKTLSENGQKIIDKRKELADFINKRLENYYHELAGKEKGLTFVYKPSLWGEDLLESLHNARERDIRDRITTVGPHRDNWEIELPEGPAYKFISRGELRTITLALKLCERDWFLARGTEKPVILLDDVFSELDEERRRYLIDAFKGSQLIMTTTDLDHLDCALRAETQLIDIQNVQTGNQPQLELETSSKGLQEAAGEQS